MAGPSLTSVVAFSAALGYVALYQGSLDAGLPALFSVLRQRSLLTGAVLHLFPTRLILKVLGGTLLPLVLLKVGQTLWVNSERDHRWDGPGKPLLFPCQTRHARLFPKKHLFDYSYLVVGLPVEWEGCAGGMISVGRGPLSDSWLSLQHRPRKGWYHVNAEDYLERGQGNLGLRGKLNKYLISQGADPANYPHAYLITAAKFLGYHFNPVSFWYLYDANKSLAAMVLEVNNTFDERRMYFLTPDDESKGQIELNPSPAANLNGGNPARTVMKQTWPKDFHVSPFNSRKGSYSLSASDPLSPLMQGTGPINSTINLISSKGHGKLVARLLPDGPAIDPYTMTMLQRLGFLASWWWVGFVTFPRICQQAFILFFQRQLHVWYRPEPLKESIGRNADATERQLELVFRRYLRHLVEQATDPVAVKYLPSGMSDDAKELILSKSAAEGSGSVQELEFKVLTPAFYTRFVHYAHDLEAMFCELRVNNTIWVSRPDLLPKLVIKKPSQPLKLSNLADFVYFRVIQALRTRPEQIERPLTSSDQSIAKPPLQDIRDFRISSMDAYVLACESSPDRKEYRNAVLRLFLAERIALGSVPLLEVERLLLQAILAWIISPVLDGIVVRLLSFAQV